MFDSTQQEHANHGESSACIVIKSIKNKNAIDLTSQLTLMRYHYYSARGSKSESKTQPCLCNIAVLLNILYRWKFTENIRKDWKRYILVHAILSLKQLAICQSSTLINNKYGTWQLRGYSSSSSVSIMFLFILWGCRRYHYSFSTNQRSRSYSLCRQ